jgi:phospholipid transport system substrate-binding protein
LHSFRISVGTLFIDAFRALTPENINVVEIKTKEDKGRAKVQFTSSDNAMVELLFSMRKKEGGWLVVNFLVDGVNMGLAYRNVFDAQMKKYGNLDMLISRWNIDLKSG